MMLLTSLTIFSGEYRILKSEDGRWYLDQETLIALANYIQKLEDLNENYKAQIANLEEQVRNLKEMVALYEKKVASLEDEKAQLLREIEKLKAQQTMWIVVTAIAVGGIVYLFVR